MKHISFDDVIVEHLTEFVLFFSLLVGKAKSQNAKIYSNFDVLMRKGKRFIAYYFNVKFGCFVFSVELLKQVSLSK